MTMTDGWQPIDTAPRDGTLFIGANLGPERELIKWRMKWGVASRPEDHYLANSGEPSWIDESARYLMPTPTHWKPAKYFKT